MSMLRKRVLERVHINICVHSGTYILQINPLKMWFAPNVPCLVSLCASLGVMLETEGM